MEFFANEPLNYDRDKYVWVNSKEGSYLRKKRGSIKPAMLNTAYEQGANRMKLSAPAASRIVNKLKPYLRGLTTGRLHARISGKLRKGLKETESIELCYLKDLDLQPEHPMGRLLIFPFTVEVTEYELNVRIPITDSTVKQHSNIVTDFYFELVLLYGDATKEQGLRTESEESSVYAIGKAYKNECRLCMVLPEQPWIALLKISCIEGNEPAAASRNYGMKVVATRDAV